MVEASSFRRLSESVVRSLIRCSLSLSRGSISFTAWSCNGSFESACRAMRERRLAGHLERSRRDVHPGQLALISLTRRVFSATSCINRRVGTTPGTGCRCAPVPRGRPCLHPAAMSSAIGSHAPRARRRQLRVIFLNLLPDWRDVGHRCQVSTTGSVGQVLHRKALHSSPSLLLFRREGTNDRNHRGFGHPSGHPTYVLSRWLFLRLLGVVYLVAFVSLALQSRPRGRARHPSRGRVPRTGARRPRERGLPACSPRSAGWARAMGCCTRWRGEGGPLPAARGWGRAGPGPAGPMDLLPVAHRCRPDLPLVPVDGLLLETGLLAVLYRPSSCDPAWYASPRLPRRCGGSSGRSCFG